MIPMMMADRGPSYLHCPMSSWETLEATMKRAEDMARPEEAGSGGHSVEHMSHTLLKLGQLCTVFYFSCGRSAYASLKRVSLTLTSAGEGNPKKMRSTVAESRSTSRVSFARKLVFTPSIAVTVPSKGAEEVV